MKHAPAAPRRVCKSQLNCADTALKPTHTQQSHCHHVAKELLPPSFLCCQHMKALPGGKVEGWAGSSVRGLLLRPAAHRVCMWPLPDGERTGLGCSSSHTLTDVLQLSKRWRRTGVACQALPKLTTKPRVKSQGADSPLHKGNLNAQATQLVLQPFLPPLLPQKFTNDVTYGNGSPESISALLQFVLS